MSTLKAKTSNMNLTRVFDIILKGQSYGVGTIRTWANGKQYQKQTDGKWVEHGEASNKKEAKTKKEKVGFMKREESLLKLENEKGYLYSPDGDVIGVYHGDDKCIKFEKEDMLSFKGNVFTHNHPSYLKKEGYANEHGNSFSIQDIGLAFATNMKEIRAVAGKYIYSFKRKDGDNISSADEFKGMDLSNAKSYLFDIILSIQNLDTEIKKEFYPLILNKGLDRDEASFKHWHEVWSRFVKKYKDFEYTKTKVL